MKSIARTNTLWTAGLLCLAAGGLTACSKGAANFDSLATAQSFTQNAATVNNKIDIMWVVDNSGSMDPLQQELVTNFSSFINNFQTKGFDYNMVVTTTDAYLANAAFDNTPSMAAYRDGANGTLSGYYYITPEIPNIAANFVTNATQGANGSGDERAYQSMFESLGSSLNSGFPRAGSFFAVVILSDEDDFTDYTRPEISWTRGGIADHDYANTNMPTVAAVKAQLDQLTNSTSSKMYYNVSAITVLDQACQSAHLSQSPSTIVGQRYIDLANMTNGILGSVCDSSYANSLNFIQQRIVELTTAFPLTTVPNASSLGVSVNGVAIPQDATNGWTYDAASNSIQFHGTAVPSASAAISVNFLPTSLSN